MHGGRARARPHAMTHRGGNVGRGACQQRGDAVGRNDVTDEERVG